MKVMQILALAMIKNNFSEFTFSAIRYFIVLKINSHLKRNIYTAEQEFGTIQRNVFFNIRVMLDTKHCPLHIFSGRYFFTRAS